MAVKKILTNTEEKAVIYIGPDIKNVVKKHAVLIGLPQVLIDFKAKCPEIAHLLVNIGEDYKNAKQALATKGSLIRHYYEEVFNHIQAKGE